MRQSSPQAAASPLPAPSAATASASGRHGLQFCAGAPCGGGDAQCDNPDALPSATWPLAACPSPNPSAEKAGCGSGQGPHTAPPAAVAGDPGTVLGPDLGRGSGGDMSLGSQGAPPVMCATTRSLGSIQHGDSPFESIVLSQPTCRSTGSSMRRSALEAAATVSEDGRELASGASGSLGDRGRTAVDHAVGSGGAEEAMMPGLGTEHASEPLAPASPAPDVAGLAGSGAAGGVVEAAMPGSGLGYCPETVTPLDSGRGASERRIRLRKRGAAGDSEPSAAAAEAPVHTGVLGEDSAENRDSPVGGAAACAFGADVPRGQLPAKRRRTTGRALGALAAWVWGLAQLRLPYPTLPAASASSAHMAAAAPVAGQGAGLGVGLAEGREPAAEAVGGAPTAQTVPAELCAEPVLLLEGSRSATLTLAEGSKGAAAPVAVAASAEHGMQLDAGLVGKHKAGEALSELDEGPDLMEGLQTAETAELLTATERSFEPDAVHKGLQAAEVAPAERGGAPDAVPEGTCTAEEAPAGRGTGAQGVLEGLQGAEEGPAEHSAGCDAGQEGLRAAGVPEQSTGPADGAPTELGMKPDAVLGGLRAAWRLAHLPHSEFGFGLGFPADVPPDPSADFAGMAQRLLCALGTQQQEARPPEGLRLTIGQPASPPLGTQHQEVHPAEGLPCGVGQPASPPLGGGVPGARRAAPWPDTDSDGSLQARARPTQPCLPEAAGAAQRGCTAQALIGEGPAREDGGGLFRAGSERAGRSRSCSSDARDSLGGAGGGSAAGVGARGALSRSRSRSRSPSPDMRSPGPGGRCAGAQGARSRGSWSSVYGEGTHDARSRSRSPGSNPNSASQPHTRRPSRWATPGANFGEPVHLPTLSRSPTPYARCGRGQSVLVRSVAMTTRSPSPDSEKARARSISEELCAPGAPSTQPSPSVSPNARRTRGRGSLGSPSGSSARKAHSRSPSPDPSTNPNLAPLPVGSSPDRSTDPDLVPVRSASQYAALSDTEHPSPLPPNLPQQGSGQACVKRAEQGFAPVCSGAAPGVCAEGAGSGLELGAGLPQGSPTGAKTADAAKAATDFAAEWAAALRPPTSWRMLQGGVWPGERAPPALSPPGVSRSPLPPHKRTWWPRSAGGPGGNPAGHPGGPEAVWQAGSREEPSNDAGPGVDPLAEAHAGDVRKRALMRRAARRVPAAAMGRAVTAVGGPLWSAAMAPVHAQGGAASPLNLPSPPMRRRLAWEQSPQVAAHGQDQGAVPSLVGEYAPLDLKPLPEPSAHAGPGPAQAADARAAARRVTPAFLPLRPVLAVPDPVSGHGPAAPAWMWGSGMRQPAVNLHAGRSLQEAAPHEADSSQAR